MSKRKASQHRSIAAGAMFLIVMLLLVGLLAGCGGGGSSSTGGSEGSGASGESEASGESVSSEESGSGESGSTYLGVVTAATEYWAGATKAVNTVASSAGNSFQALSAEGSGQKALENFSTLFARGCENCSVVMDPVENAVAEAILRNGEKSGAWMMTSCDKPETTHPWEFGEHWVGHFCWNGEEGGYESTKVMLEAMGGKGNVLDVRGVANSEAGRERRAGFLKAVAEFPEVHVLDEQIGGWETPKAQEVTETMLSKYGNEVDGIYAANDAMALGALEALKANGLNGKVLLAGNDGETPALEAIKNGEMVASVSLNGDEAWAYAAALTIAASRGELKPEELPNGKREFFMKQSLITKKNVDEFLNYKFDPAEFTYAKLKEDLWANYAGAMKSAEE